MYAICKVGSQDTLFWSNEQGWVDFTTADLFDDDERATLNLPTDGEWAALWEINQIQFARLIAEAEAVGVFTKEVLVNIACEMDVEANEVCEIIDRAQRAYDDMKARLTPGEDRRA